LHHVAALAHDTQSIRSRLTMSGKSREKEMIDDRRRDPEA
jgi:hypothetical protein